MPDAVGPDDLFATPDAAVYLHSKPGTLENWRWLKKGPRFCRISARKILYRRKHLDAFVEAHMVD